MSHPEYHGTQEAVDEFLTVGIDLAVKAAHQRRVSRFQREEAARTLGRDAWRAEHAKQNLDRLTASAKCAAVQNDEWWQRATPSQIVDAYRDAKTYEHEDPPATSALVRITAEIRDRFGIDAAALERARRAGRAAGAALRRAPLAQRRHDHRRTAGQLAAHG